MRDIVSKIDAFTTAFMAEHYPSSTSRLFGYCELTQQKDQPIVATINGTADRNKACLDDQYDLVTWVRLPGNIRTAPSEEDNWGLKEGRRQNASLRWIVAHKVELGEEFIHVLLQDLPGSFPTAGYHFVLIDPTINVDADHEKIYETELGKTNYEKHRFNWNIYAVELNVEYIVCESLTSP
jgi:hypothetical protein